MIDVENDVFDYVYPYVSPLVPEGCFQSMYVRTPPALPFATLIEFDNYTDQSTQDTSDNEVFSVLAYTAEAYAESKAECRRVMDAINQAMHSLGFRRLSMRFVDNMADTTIFRLVSRYRAKADENKTIYRER